MIARDITDLVVLPAAPLDTSIMWYDTTASVLKQWDGVSAWKPVQHIKVDAHRVHKIYKDNQLLFDDKFEIVTRGTLNASGILAATELSSLQAVPHGLMANFEVNLTAGKVYEFSVSGAVENTDATAKLRVDLWSSGTTPPQLRDPSDRTNGDVQHSEIAIPLSQNALYIQRGLVTIIPTATGKYRITVVGDGHIDALAYQLSCTSYNDVNSTKSQILRMYRITRTDKEVRYQVNVKDHGGIHFSYSYHKEWRTKPDPFGGDSNAVIMQHKWLLLCNNAGTSIVSNGKTRFDASATFYSSTADELKVRVEAYPAGAKIAENSPGTNALPYTATAPNHTSPTAGATVAPKGTHSSAEDWVEFDYDGPVVLRVWVYADQASSKVSSPYVCYNVVGELKDKPTAKPLPLFAKRVQADIKRHHHGAAHVVYASDQKEWMEQIAVTAIEDKGRYSKDYNIPQPFDITIQPTLGAVITDIIIDNGPAIDLTLPPHTYRMPDDPYPPQNRVVHMYEGIGDKATFIYPKNPKPYDQDQGGWRHLAVVALDFATMKFVDAVAAGLVSWNSTVSRTSGYEFAYKGLHFPFIQVGQNDMTQPQPDIELNFLPGCANHTVYLVNLNSHFSYGEQNIPETAIAWWEFRANPGDVTGLEIDISITRAYSRNPGSEVRPVIQMDAKANDIAILPYTDVEYNEYWFSAAGDATRFGGGSGSQPRYGGHWTLPATGHAAGTSIFLMGYDPLRSLTMKVLEIQFV